MTRQGTVPNKAAKVSTPDRGGINKDDENKIPPYPSPYADTFLIDVRLLRPDSAKKTKSVNNDTGIRNETTRECGESPSENTLEKK